MKLQILSDTHNSEYTISSEADVIIHAGDFSNQLSGMLKFAETCKKLNKRFIFVLGNHDYYNSNYNSVIEFLKKNYPENALLADNHIQIQDKIFVGGTLFSNFRSNSPSYLLMNFKSLKMMLSKLYMILKKSRLAMIIES